MNLIKIYTYNLLVNKFMKKKRNDNLNRLRNAQNQFVNEKDLEENIKNEINKEINNSKRKKFIV